MQGSSVEIPDDDSILEEIFHDLDFDFDLSHVHSDATNLLQSFVKGEVVKSLLKKQYQKVSLLKNAAVKKKESMARSLLQRRKNFSSENLIALLEAKKKQFEETVNAPPFIRTSDKIAFTLGILGMCITEWILLTKQNLMYIWYTILLVPLMIARYVTYSKSKYQYFMLDFCYFAQLMMLAHLYIIPQNTLFFQVAFAASNGPLLVGLVMWRNSIVFHDLDKLTSVFIHFFPPLVSFCARWYPPNNDFSAVCGEEECSTSMSTVLGVTMAFYTFWQVLYLIQTEIIDKKKLQADCQIMTSFRWMSEVKPHPLWRIYRKFGAQAKHAAYYLVVTQFFYTLLTLLPIIPIFHSFNMHCIYLSLVFAICVWNGANFYFDIFTETYSKRLQKFIKQAIKEEENQVNDNAHTNGQEEPIHKEVEPVISQVELKEGSE